MSDDELVATMTELATKSRRPEQKIWRGESKTATLAEPLTDTGTFTGYLAVVNNRDHQGDTILPGALDETLAEFRAGRIAWLLTDSHSEFATDVIARVTEASMDADRAGAAAPRDGPGRRRVGPVDRLLPGRLTAGRKGRPPPREGDRGRWRGDA
jgi:hypothetical protein